VWPLFAVPVPTLFNIFTSDSPTLTDIQLALFADDSALFSTHAKADVIIIDRLQSALNIIKRYYLPWRIKLNPSKTQAVFFTKRRDREFPTSDLSLGGYSISWSDCAKYLGLILDKKPTFSPHLDYVSDMVQKFTRIFRGGLAIVTKRWGFYNLPYKMSKRGLLKEFWGPIGFLLYGMLQGPFDPSPLL
jgi:hypothetical protein